MKETEAQMRAGHILRELGEFPSGLFTMSEMLFLASRCRRLAGALILTISNFGEADLYELERIAARVKETSRGGMKLLKFPSREER